MQNTVDDMQRFIQNSANSMSQRDSQLQLTLDKLTDQTNMQENMRELLPVLENICAEYGQRQNSMVC